MVSFSTFENWRLIIQPIGVRKGCAMSAVSSAVTFFSDMGAPTEDAGDVRNAGCLVVNATFELTPTSPAIREEVGGYRAMFRDRFAEALRADGVADADIRVEHFVGSLWRALGRIRLAGSTEAAKPVTNVVIATVEGWRRS